MVDPSPADLGFRMPAEWTPQAAVWLSWPLNPVTWRDRREALLTAYARFAAAISHHEPVRINCVVAEQAGAREHLRNAGADPARDLLHDPHLIGALLGWLMVTWWLIA